MPILLINFQNIDLQSNFESDAYVMMMMLEVESLLVHHIFGSSWDI